MPHRAVLFDLDGTLLNTLTDLAGAMNRALATLGFPPHPVDDYRYIIGDGVWAFASRSLPEEQRDDPMIGRCVGLLRSEYADHWADATSPYEGVPALLDGLVAHGTPMAVFSNKPDDFTKLCVERLLPDWTFASVAGESATTPRKPDPRGALAAAATMGVAPDEVLYVGDTSTDMTTAVAAGMRPVGVLWGFREAEELNAHGAETLIERPEELLGLLG